MKIVLLFLFIPVMMYGYIPAANPILYSPNLIPTLTGKDTACSGQGGCVYTTDAGMTNYVWHVSGGTITAGGTSNSNTATVTWNTPGTDTVTVTYTGASGPAVKYVTVLQSLPVTITITSSGNPVCAGTPVTFTATLTNGGSNPFYLWKVDGFSMVDNNPVFTYTPADGDNVVCVVTSTLPCSTGSPATSNQITMTVIPVLPVNVAIIASANPVCHGTPVTFTATPLNEGSSPTYQWKGGITNVGAGQTTYTYIPQDGDG